MFLPAIEHDFCLNPTVTRSLSPFITPNVLASPFFISKSTITAISLIPLFRRGGQGEVCCGQVRGECLRYFLPVLNHGQRTVLFFGLGDSLTSGSRLPTLASLTSVLSPGLFLVLVSTASASVYFVCAYSMPSTYFLTQYFPY